MKKRYKIVVAALPVLAIIGLAVWYLKGLDIAVLEPAGQIAQKERDLMLFAIILAAIVVIPTYTMTIIIAMRYREGNTKAKYSPDWDHSRLFESLWWGIPIIIITILSVVTWQSSHALDPFKPLASSVKPLNVQVVALDWKWLFIYPSQNIASVNLLPVPVNTPIDFNITSDSVMNSFWIPNLGGQIYAMPGMDTQLHLIANKTGDFNGVSANISGQGFAGMTFVTKSTSQTSFNNWVKSAKHSKMHLTMSLYHQLAMPSLNTPLSVYSSVTNNLFQSIILKYMEPAPSSSTMQMGSMS